VSSGGLVTSQEAGPVGEPLPVEQLLVAVGGRQPGRRSRSLGPFQMAHIMNWRKEAREHLIRIGWRESPCLRAFSKRSTSCTARNCSDSQYESDVWWGDSAHLHDPRRNACDVESATAPRCAPRRTIVAPGRFTPPPGRYPPTNPIGIRWRNCP